MLIRIYLKSGNVLPDFHCDEFTATRSRVTGELDGYEFKGGKIPRPLYVNLSQVEAICRVDTEPMPDNDRVAELEAELARAMFYITAQKACETCKNRKPTACWADCGDCCMAKSCICAGCFDGSKWEWVGAHGHE